ncbi:MULTISPECIES: hypothetical protein [Chryseobacterium]|uniref:hypothetical protein n=1 Tax=Chryseobacterium TaxID=59732 RepID=UPI001D14F9DB|nr:hypothetical protein [Chryseobacterium sp. X308]MCC3215545.1 hypothetical protein [Chryseobacterium sp. X308]
MNYNQFSKKESLIDDILAKLGILITKKLIIKIDHEPDYEISEYTREREKEYYLQNFWNFKNKFNSVVEAEVLENHILHYDNFIQLSEEYNIPFCNDEECEFLLDVLKKDNDALIVYGFGTDAGNFRINNLRIKSIDNLKARVHYDGSFYGSSYEINQNDFAVYSILYVNALPLDIDSMPFYYSLLGESHLLLKEKKYKLSYFLLYSAFESFINYELGRDEEEGRLKDKLNELFCLKFPNLGIHQIYTSIITLFDKYTLDRNSIAHGRNMIDVDDVTVKKSFIFVLTMISAYLLNSSKFDDLYSKIKN